MRAYAVVVLALGCVVAATTPALAQKIEITPFIGWETSGSYPLTDATGATTSTQYSELRADANETYGFSFDYSLTDNIQAEFLWALNPTTYSALNITTGQYEQAFKTHINQYQFGALYLLRDRQNALRPYLVGSIGFTHDSDGGANPNRTAMSFGLGGGIKYAFSSHFGLNTEARWIPTYGSAGLGTYCDSGGYGGYGLDAGYDPYGYGGYGGCYQSTIHNYLQRINVVVGLTIRP